ncbi:FAD-dependent oxidoreductase [Actinomadura graeca]|uniref:FAD-dependent oxidoreductase n=1 Tax=Actinomadura graeca TaxID=2750812 RepID=A0ABX8R001_9ACTN|nr:FAD-dependent oxidoreductase [Actinomadura graeca]QXJ23589.1 FAD-dependent oxidoreductase [Actinomadura graeca]
MEKHHEGSSRRNFLGMAASATLLQVMTGAVPAHAETAPAGLFKAPAGKANGKSVVILGAGVSGMTVAGKLIQAGYAVTVLEARDRTGGRAFTVRRGDKITEVWADGSSRTITCQFDPGLYLNAGPSRLSHQHQRVLALCRRFRIPLEPYIMQSTANLYQTDKAWKKASKTHRRIAFDTAGYVAAYAAAAVKKGIPGDTLTDAQREKLLTLLVEFGQLDKTDHTYTGSVRAGLAKPLSVTQMAEKIDPLRLTDLLQSEFWNDQFYRGSDIVWQGTMFQPIGGMDIIARSIAKTLPAGTVTLNAPVHAIRLGDDGVRISWKDAQGTHDKTFDHCLSSIPIPVLRQQVHLEGFSTDFTWSIQNAQAAPTCKVGWQANQRFWESDKYQIYGGISWLGNNVRQIVYPSNDFFSPTGKGTLTGAYASYDAGAEFGDLTHDQRLATARAAGAKLHEEFNSQAIVPDDKAISIAWHKVPYTLHGWAHWDPDVPDHKKIYQTLIYPQGNNNFMVIGDQLSPLPGWQEGALMSAEWAFEWIHGDRRIARVPVQQVPDSKALTTGHTT